jgi:hypothetical protein
MFGRKGPFARLMAKLILWAFGANKATKAYNNIMNQPDQSLTTILREIKVGVDVDAKSIANIPAEGPAIIICNHPTGIVDGIVMLHAITQVRQDVKVLGNFLLNRVEPITPYLFPVNPFEEKQGGSLAGLKLGLKHLSEGGCLLLITPQEEPRRPIVYALAQEDHLLDLALRWRQVAEDPPYIALYTAPMGYRLAVYADTPLSEAYRRLLDEYGWAVGHGHGTVAHCGEYGEWLDAAALFTAPVPPQPAHGDPPH